MIALALVAALMVQDTNTALSPRVRAMLDRFPPPASGMPSITVRFSRDTVWVGEQVELVTAAWFPRSVRDRLRRMPAISSPLLAGVWSARNQQLPIPSGTRVVGGQVYDLYVSWQTIFPLGPGRVEAPPATLTYNLPTSTAYFAPEEKKTFRSTAEVLVVRPVPPAESAALGAGPTGRNLRIAWRGAVNVLRAGAPAVVELAISGEGNLTLWPAPTIVWPAGVRVYPEPTLENMAAAQGLIAGEKRFRFTLVADSVGVLALPAVAYPYFDPSQVRVVQATAAAVTLPILERAATASDRRALTVSGAPDEPFATVLVRGWWAILLAVVLVPPAILIRRGRRTTLTVRRSSIADPEAELRAALGTPVDAGQDHIVAALRLRGVPREDAEHVHRWLSAVGRRRYGPSKLDIPEPPPVFAQVMVRLRTPVAMLVLLCAALPLHAQREDGIARFAGGDYPGAARAFAADAHAAPLAAGVWRDLGAARWMAHDDDVGAAAAWLTALALAPRDPLLRADWAAATAIPADVRGRAPTIPLSRDELLLAALVLWLGAWAAAFAGWRRTAWIVGTSCAASLLVAATRWQVERPGQGLITANTILRISPHPATTAVGELSMWSSVRVERRLDGWVLVGGQINAPGSVAAVAVEGWIPAASIAPIGPLD